MKVRNGFVSNSSTSSFCIVGLGFNDFLLNKFYNIKFEDLPEGNFKTWLSKKAIKYNYEEICPGDEVGDYLWSLGLRNHTEAGEYDFVIGVDWDNMGEDETKAQFKKRVKETITKVFQDLDIQKDLTNRQVEEISGEYCC